MGVNMIENIEISGGFWSKLKGLLFRDSINEDEAMLFLNCSRVHTSFMKFDICVIYLDEKFNVIEHEILKPWKKGSKIKGTKHIIEASPKIAANIGRNNKILLRMEEIEND